MKGLSTAYPIDTDLKVVKDSDGTNSALEISKDKVRVKDLEVTGTTIGINEESTTVDSSLTDGSTNPVENNAVFDGLALKLDKTGGDLTGDITITDTTAPQLVLKYALTNKITFGVASTGTTTLTTSGSGTTDSDFILDIDGDIALDSANGIFIAKNNGTEFSAANSSYAGMILGYTRLEGDLTNTNSFEIQDAMTVEDATHKITFVTPPSENVEIELTCFIDTGTTDTKISVGLSDNSTYNALAENLEYDYGVFFTDDELDDDLLTVKFILDATDLASVGSSNTFYIGFSTTGSTKTAHLRYGLRASHGICYHPMVIKATALPSTIYDGS